MKKKQTKKNNQLIKLLIYKKITRELEFKSNFYNQTRFSRHSTQQGV